MNKTVKTITCAVLVLAIICGLAACSASGTGSGNSADPINVICVSIIYDANGNPGYDVVGTTTYTPGVTSQQTTPTAAADTTAAPAGTADTTAAPSGTADTTAAPSGTADTTAAQNSSNTAPTSVADIIAYYKTAYAKASTQAKSVTKTYTNAKNEPAICEAGSLSSIASKLMGMFLKAETVNEVSTTLTDLPPKGFNSCSLTEDLVAKATCKDDGTYYEIYIELNPTQDNPDINPSAGSKTGSIVSVVEASEVESAASSFVKFTNLQNKYFGANLTAKIDKATGNLVELYTVNPSTMCFDKVTAAGILSVDNARIGLTYEEKWTVQW